MERECAAWSKHRSVLGRLRDWALYGHATHECTRPRLAFRNHPGDHVCADCGLRWPLSWLERRLASPVPQNTEETS
jgi:hypothetical protein